MIPPSIDVKLGMLIYLTSSPRLGGKLRGKLSDFIVDEVLMGKRASKVLLGKEIFPNNGPFHYLVAAKFTRMNTRKLVSRISNILGGKVRYAGLKDSNSISFQFLSIEGRHKIMSLKNGFLVKPVGKYVEPISRGVNDGNYFTLVVRGVSSLPESSEFPNFFSYQRFGFKEPFNYEIGKAMLLRSLKEAIDLIERQGYQVGSVRSLKQLAGSLGIDLLRLYIHSYQSYLFNVLLSRRILHSLKPELGDFVLKYNREIELYSGGRRELLLPLIGGMSKEKGEWLKEEVRKLLRDEGISKEMFLFRELPEISALGGLRKAVGRALSTRILGRSSYAIVSFFLESGMYATSYMRELLKPLDPEAQGFI